MRITGPFKWETKLLDDNFQRLRLSSPFLTDLGSDMSETMHLPTAPTRLPSGQQPAQQAVQPTTEGDLYPVTSLSYPQAFWSGSKSYNSGTND
ncbi:hypothetical protein Tco_0685587 [Tanacetum coccineum]